MAWKENKVEKQRELFIKAYFENRFTFSDICRQFEISRKCGYKWLARFEEEGLKGLKDRARTPLSCPHATDSEIVDELLRIKFRWPKWGPKKVLGHLENKKPQFVWPSVTTVENIFKKKGLVEKRKLRRRLAERKDPLVECNASNDIWCIDFKGWSLTQDNKKCDPFTVMDAFSRFLLCCQKLDMNDTQHVWAVFERLFREYGLPLRIRSDNGPPFATLGAGRLSKLSINLIKAGVIPEWIDPGEPQQNGRHERMHLTLEQEGIDTLKSMQEQVQRLNEFTGYYNFVRPHEALQQKSPSDVYKPSERYWHGRLESPEYSNEFEVGKVRSCGKMTWKGKEIYIGRAFEGEPIGLREEEAWKAYYGTIFLGVIREDTLEIERRPGRKRIKI